MQIFRISKYECYLLFKQLSKVKKTTTLPDFKSLITLRYPLLFRDFGVCSPDLIVEGFYIASALGKETRPYRGTCFFEFEHLRAGLLDLCDRAEIGEVIAEELEHLDTLKLHDELLRCNLFDRLLFKGL